MQGCCHSGPVVPADPSLLPCPPFGDSTPVGMCPILPPPQSLLTAPSLHSPRRLVWGDKLHAQLNPQRPACLSQKPDGCPSCLLPGDPHSSAFTKPSGLDRLYTFRPRPRSTPSPSASAGSPCLQPCVSPTLPQAPGWPAQGTFLNC